MKTDCSNSFNSPKWSICGCWSMQCVTINAPVVWHSGHTVSSCDQITAKVGRKWKWPHNSTGKSKMDLFWCISVKSYKKFKDKAQTANFSNFTMGCKGLCSSMQCNVSPPMQPQSGTLINTTPTTIAHSIINVIYFIYLWMFNDMWCSHQFGKI